MKLVESNHENTTDGQVGTSNNQKQLVTLSGGFQEGSVRVIRNGIGLQEQVILYSSSHQSIFLIFFY